MKEEEFRSMPSKEVLDRINWLEDKNDKNTEIIFKLKTKIKRYEDRITNQVSEELDKGMINPGLI